MTNSGTALHLEKFHLEMLHRIGKQNCKLLSSEYSKFKVINESNLIKLRVRYIDFEILI